MQSNNMEQVHLQVPSTNTLSKNSGT